MKHDFKQITPTDKFSWHQQLLPMYERLFYEIRDTPERIGGSLLEIGTDGGGGLLMYDDYFPHFRILGIDINPCPQGLTDWIKEHPGRIGHMQRDAYTQEQINELAFGPRFDIIIDDGPHTIGSQVFFVSHYPQLLTEDGLAIVEDIQDPSHIQLLGSHVPDGFFSFAVDMRHVEPKRYDNFIFCIQRA